MTLSFSKSTCSKSATFNFVEKSINNIADLISNVNTHAILATTQAAGYRRYENILKIHQVILFDIDDIGEEAKVDAALSPYWYIKKPSTSNNGIVNTHKWHYIVKAKNIIQYDPKNKQALKNQRKHLLQTLGLDFLKDSRTVMTPVQNMNCNPNASWAIENTVFNDGATLELTTNDKILNPYKNITKSKKITCRPSIDKKITTATLSNTSNIQRWIDQGFVEGNRNNYLFAIGYKLVYENQKEVFTIHQTLQDINFSHSNPLTKKEVFDITENIIRYESSMNRKNNTPKYQRGKYFNEMQAAGIHGDYNRKSFGAFKSAGIKRDKTIKSIVAAIKEIVENEHSFIINDRIAVLAGVCKRTVQYVKKDIDFAAVVKEFQELKKRKLLSLILDISANCTPKIKRVFAGVKKRIEKILLPDGQIKIVEIALTPPEIKRIRVPG